MSGLIGFLKRFYNVFFPPATPKSEDALRFGILGAANIAPLALITPAKSHREVIIAAVAARDPQKAEAFAKRHNIPIVHQTYEDLITDPSLDCIYIPLPNGLHYEWTIRALRAGKHVLLEKPSVSNATEARSLFRHPILQKPDSPVLLEAFHYRFHPAWQYFMGLFDATDVEFVEVRNTLPAGIFSLDDIRFNYSLSGGTLMDFGCYALSSMRAIFGEEPSSIDSASYRPMPEGFDQGCDQAVYATYRFPNGGTAKISADLQARGGWPFPALTKNWPKFAQVLPTITVRLKERREVDGSLVSTHRKEIVFHNYMGPHLYHRIDITNESTTEDTSVQGRKPRHSKKTEYRKMYKWEHDNQSKAGEDWWGTYRWQLEAFVDRVKKRPGSGVWVDGEESIKQVELIDATYLKMGLPLRPTSKDLENEP